MEAKSNYIYIQKGDRRLDKLIKKNTFRNPKFIACDKINAKYPEDEDEYLTFYSTNGEVYAFPRNSIDVDGYVDCFRSTELSSSFKARTEDQEDLISFVVNLFSDNRKIVDAVVTSPTGSGKTIMACEIACRLKLPTLIVTHKDSLASQFKESIEILFGGKAKVGTVKGKQIEYGDTYDFVLASATTLATKRFPDDFYRSFGLVIYDEVHRYGAPVLWNAVLGEFYCKNRLGITATFRRKDNLIGVIENHLGPVVYESRTKVLPASVYQIHVQPKDLKKLKNYTRREQVYLVNNKYAEDQNIRDRIVALAKKFQSEGRYTMIMCQQVSQVDYYAKALSKYNPSTIHGAKHGLDTNDNRRLVITTLATSKEGLDIPELDSIILASPVSDPEQVVGRILRKPTQHDKLIVDIVLSGSVISSSMASKRLNYYCSAGFKIGGL